MSMLEIQCRSVAGRGTAVMVRYPRSTLLFDCGVEEEFCLRASHIFLTHCHLDHCLMCFWVARMRKMTSSMVCTFYVPEQNVKAFEAARDCLGELDGSPLLMSVVAVSPGMTIVVDSETSVMVCVSTHRVPSCGYAVIRTKEKMKAAVATLPVDEKRKLLKVHPRNELFDIETTVDFAYTGDTTVEGLMADPLYRVAKTLCMELTFIRGDKQKAVKTGHMHISDLVAVQDSLECSELLLVHFSAKYSYADIVSSLLDSLALNTLVKCVPLLSKPSTDSLYARNIALDILNDSRIKLDTSTMFARISWLVNLPTDILQVQVDGKEISAEVILVRRWSSELFHLIWIGLLALKHKGLETILVSRNAVECGNSFVSTDTGTGTSLVLVGTRDNLESRFNHCISQLYGKYAFVKLE